ncbi:uncharacterized protein LOC136026129 isoform X4 [Artemia franciscana]|uniref:uncharacterized protein LOC136026129 isoform X4 n=1 Tax=Artemia franciscana TaxID=6661 RepID=UPI0032DA7D4B
MYQGRTVRQCYREAIRHGQSTSRLCQTSIYMKRCLPRKGYHNLKHLLFVASVPVCMPIAIIIAIANAVWTFAKTRLVLFQFRKYGVVAINPNFDDEETLYEAIFIADGKIERPHLLSKFSNKECASYFLDEPLEKHHFPWRITMQYLQDGSCQTLLTLKCDRHLKQIICDTIIGNHESSSPCLFVNTKYVTQYICDITVDLFVAILNYMRHMAMLASELKLFTLAVNVFELVVSLCTMSVLLLITGIKWLFGIKPNFLQCDFWKELILSFEELQYAAKFTFEFTSRCFYFPIVATEKRSAHKLQLRCLRRIQSDFSNVFINSNCRKYASYPELSTSILWTQPITEDILWRLCNISSKNRLVLLTSICVSELKRSTFDLEPAFLNSSVSLNFENDYEILLEPCIKWLSEENIEKELSRLNNSIKEAKFKKLAYEKLMKVIPNFLWKSKIGNIGAEVVLRFNSPFEDAKFLNSNILLHADVSQGSHKIVFNIHRSSTCTFITCTGISESHLRYLTMNVERRIYALASQLGVQTQRLSPYSSPNNLKQSQSWKKNVRSSSYSNVRDCEKCF